jgi:RNA polymerase sigma-70 factor (ECF subfamily)
MRRIMAGSEQGSLDDRRDAARGRFRVSDDDRLHEQVDDQLRSFAEGSYEPSEELSQAVRRASLGDEDALTALYVHFNPPLLRFLKGRHPAIAEDLAGEVWVSVAKGLGNFVGDDRDFRAWLFATARRRGADHFRRMWRRPRIAPGEHLDELEPSLGDGTEIDAQVEIDDAVRALVTGLSSEQAEVLLLRVVAGLSAAEVAEIVGKAEGTVRVIQSRALARLAKKFRDEL